MHFDFSDDQYAMRDAVRKFLEHESPRALARDLIESGGFWAEPVWRGLVELGITGLMLPEPCGGVGLGAEELCLSAQELGRQLSPVPLSSTLYLGAQALLLGADEGQQERWLPAVAAGSPGSLAAPLDGGLDPGALPLFDAGTLHGEASLVQDGAVAAWAVVLARDPDGGCLWVYAALDDGVERQPLPCLDPSRPVASLRFDGTAAEPLAAVTDSTALLERVRQRAAILFAFEQIGAAEAALAMATAYARERRTFGRAIGSYQAIKHKLAGLYTQIELARAHCLFGAWALAADVASAEGAPELPRAAASARAAATDALTQTAQETLHVHGGMGYTWELDCHLFYRRARQLGVVLGSRHGWRELLAAVMDSASERGEPLPASPTAAAGAMDFDDSPEEAAFRQTCRAWLEANATPKEHPDEYFGEALSEDERMAAARAWQAKKAAAGFAAITWPEALGGRGGSTMEELIWREEEARFQVPTGFFNVSLGMVLPTLLAHAPQPVLARHVAPAIAGEHLWCQLLSEPGAGSDLGLIRTRAERCDGGWRLNGQKVWTTLAQFAEYGLVLARTDPTQPKLAGLTAFFIAMDSPGVRVQPIRQADGSCEFNEVFFDDVFIPEDQVVGEPGGGWKVTLTGLMSERMAIGGVLPAELWRATADLLRDARFGGTSALADGRYRDYLASLYLDAQGLWLLQCRAMTALARGAMPGPEMSGAKNVAAATLQRFACEAIDAQGQRGQLAAAALGRRFKLVERLWFGAAGMRIAGGTDEIVNNSIGERVLGLPGSPRADKQVPFNEIEG